MTDEELILKIKVQTPKGQAESNIKTFSSVIGGVLKSKAKHELINDRTIIYSVKCKNTKQRDKVVMRIAKWDTQIKKIMNSRFIKALPKEKAEVLREWVLKKTKVTILGN